MKALNTVNGPGLGRSRQCCAEGMNAFNRGQWDLATARFSEALTLNPGQAEACNGLGLVQGSRGNLNEAAAQFYRAITICPDYGDAHYNLGRTLLQMGKPMEAAACFHRVISLNPADVAAYEKLAWIRFTEERYEEAVDLYWRAATLEPDNTRLMIGMGLGLQKLEQQAPAEACFRRALQREPGEAVTWYNLGRTLAAQGKYEAAVDCYRQTLALQPVFLEAENNLGFACQELGRFEEAMACYAAILAREPGSANVRFNLAWLQLLQGNFAEGFKGYENRFAKDDAVARPELDAPVWDGRPLPGKTILLFAEQGLGDVIQFVRYAPLVAASGARVILTCQETLVRLLTGVAGVARVVSREQPFPEHDCHAPLLSLPGILGTSLETIPAPVPYLVPDPTLVSRWHKFFPADRSLKVGLAWFGNRRHENDRNRSCPPEHLAPLLKLPGVRIYSLQLGEGAGRAASLGMIDLTAGIRDFADTAAFMANLDLVISVDTSVAHLAGAMGMNVWTLLPFVPEWRWLLGRDDSPWYPTMRLFRQTGQGDWDGVIASVCKALQQLAGQN